MGAASRMISCRVCSPFRISLLSPINALRPSGRFLHHTIRLDATDRSLVASKEALAHRHELNNGLHSFPSRHGRTVCGKSLRSEEHTSELQSHSDLVCRLLLEKKKKNSKNRIRLKHNQN